MNDDIDVLLKAADVIGRLGMINKISQIVFEKTKKKDCSFEQKKLVFEIMDELYELYYLIEKEG